MHPGIVVAIVAFVLLLFVFGMYNRLVRARNHCNEAWYNIDTELKRRYDLIPNLVETAKTYLKHERETLEAVIAARNQAQAASKLAAAHPEDGQAVTNLGAAEGTLGASLGRFFALAESYPDLKANQTLQQLMEELSSTENKVAFSRQFFNDAVMAYNIMREKFPNNFMAGMFNFQAAKPLEIETPEARKAVKVSFS